MNKDDVVIEAFTELAPTYEETVDYELRLFWGVGYRDFIMRLIRMARIQDGEVVLDVATGTGVIPEEITQQVEAKASIVGLDITPRMLHLARRKLHAKIPDSIPHLVCGSGMEMPIGENVFDIVICGLGTHHMEVPRLITEIRRVLKPGGRFIMADVCATPFWRSPLGAVLLRGLILFYRWTLSRTGSGDEDEVELGGLSMTPTRAQAEMEAFKSILTSSEWQTLVRAMGFQDIEVEEISALRRIYPGGLIMKAVAAPK